jgi:hypothetical protein
LGERAAQGAAGRFWRATRDVREKSIMAFNPLQEKRVRGKSDKRDGEDGWDVIRLDPFGPGSTGDALRVRYPRSAQAGGQLAIQYAASHPGGANSVGKEKSHWRRQ